jgi:DNA-binding beta-propeller fold protein YncE
MMANRLATLRRALAIVVTLALVLQPNLSPQPRTSAEAAELAAPLASVPAPGFAVTDFATGFPNTGAVGPVGVAFDSNNNLLAMDYANGVLYRFGPLGGVAGATTQVNTTPIPGAPSGLAFGKDGHLYLARQSASDVLELNPTTGSIVRTVASGVPCATGIATDPLSGDLFVSTVGCSSIGVMRLSGFASGPATVTNYASPGTRWCDIRT